jgi:uncharacterized protein (TIGR03083 family)
MDRASYIDSLGADAADLLAAATGNLDAPVPSCPGWSVERLVGHVGRTYRWTARWVVTGAPPDAVERPPAGDAVVGWTRQGLVELLGTLGQAAGLDAADTTVATWAGEQPPGFWPRRMAIETALHRWDAEAAGGEARPIGTDLALDAVDELFDVLLPRRGLGELGAGGATVHLHATDITGGSGGEGEWLVTLGPDGPAVEHTHAKGDVAVRGTASDLLLLLWNRIPLDRCEVFGDAQILERWRETVKL